MSGAEDLAQALAAVIAAARTPAAPDTRRVLLIVEQAAARLAIRCSHVYEMLWLGTIRAVHLGRSRRISEVESNLLVDTGSLPTDYRLCVPAHGVRRLVEAHIPRYSAACRSAISGRRTSPNACAGSITTTAFLAISSTVVVVPAGDSCVRADDR